MPRNPLRDENQPQEQTKGEQITNLSRQQVVQFVDSEGNVRMVPLRCHESLMGPDGRYVDTEVTNVPLDPAGNPMPPDPSSVVISHSGLFIGPDDQRAICTSIFHPGNRSRNILLGQDGALAAGGAVCSVCQCRKNTIYLILGILGLGAVMGIYQAVGLL